MTPDLKNMDTFNHWTEVTLRFCDQDSLGHINNVAYGAFIEAARTTLIESVIPRLDFPNINFVLARNTINYVREMHYPGVVAVGGLFVRLGSKSLTSSFGLFYQNHCVATAESVNVFIDMISRKSIVPPKDIQNSVLMEIAKSNART